MKTVRAIVTTLIWTLAGCYLLPAILLHIPAIQEMVGEKVAEVVAETLKTNVWDGLMWGSSIVLWSMTYGSTTSNGNR